MFGRLLRQGGSYAVAGALLKAAGLLLAPLLLNPAYLTVQDYGSFALLIITAQLAIFVSGLGLSTAVLRFLTRDDPGLDRHALPFTALVLSVGAAAAAAAAFVALGKPLATVLTDDAGNAALFIPLAIYVAAKSVSSVPLALLRVRERAGLYTVSVVLEMIVLVALVYRELVFASSGLSGLLWGYAWASVVGLAVLLALNVQAIQPRFDRTAVRPLLRFGLPLILASLAGWFLNAGDRYLLKWLADREAVAAYEWSARLGGLINMLLVQSFQLAFTVVGLKALSQGAESFYRRTMRHFVIWTGFAVLLLSVWTPDGMRLLMHLFEVDSHYMQAGQLVFPLALGFGAYGVYIIVNNTLLASGRTGVIGMNVLMVALLNAVLNVLLIPVIGALGAALSTTLSYAVLAAVAAWASRRELSVSYPWRVPALVVLVLVVLVALSMLVDSWTLGPRLAARVTLCAAYVMAVPLLGLYTKEHLAAGLEGFRRVAGRSAR